MGDQILKIYTDAPEYVYQGPRFKKFGPNSGELFRDNVLIPWLEKLGDAVGIIDFDGTQVYSPSFLEETFGGAIRLGYRQVKDLKIVNVPDEWMADIRSYIDKALRIRR